MKTKRAPKTLRRDICWQRSRRPCPHCSTSGALLLSSRQPEGWSFRFLRFPSSSSRWRGIFPLQALAHERQPNVRKVDLVNKSKIASCTSWTPFSSSSYRTSMVMVVSCPSAPLCFNRFVHVAANAQCRRMRANPAFALASGFQAV